MDNNNNNSSTDAQAFEDASSHTFERGVATHSAGYPDAHGADVAEGGLGAVADAATHEAGAGEAQADESGSTWPVPGNGAHVSDSSFEENSSSAHGGAGPRDDGAASPRGDGEGGGQPRGGGRGGGDFSGGHGTAHGGAELRNGGGADGPHGNGGRGVDDGGGSRHEELHGNGGREVNGGGGERHDPRGSGGAEQTMRELLSTMREMALLLERQGEEIRRLKSGGEESPGLGLTGMGRLPDGRHRHESIPTPLGGGLRLASRVVTDEVRLPETPYRPLRERQIDPMEQVEEEGLQPGGERTNEEFVTPSGVVITIYVGGQVKLDSKRILKDDVFKRSGISFKGGTGVGRGEATGRALRMLAEWQKIVKLEDMNPGLAYRVLCCNVSGEAREVLLENPDWRVGLRQFLVLYVGEDGCREHLNSLYQLTQGKGQTGKDFFQSLFQAFAPFNTSLAKVAKLFLNSARADWLQKNVPVAQYLGAVANGTPATASEVLTKLLTAKEGGQRKDNGGGDSGGGKDDDKEKKDKKRKEKWKPGKDHCYQCGRSGHVAADCSFKKPVCFHCQSDKHLARACPKKDSAVNHVGAGNQLSSKSSVELVTIDGGVWVSELDTGAPAMLLTPEDAVVVTASEGVEALKLTLSPYEGPPLTGAGGEALTVHGTVTVELQHGEGVVTLEALVANVARSLTPPRAFGSSDWAEERRPDGTIETATLKLGGVAFVKDVYGVFVQQERHGKVVLRSELGSWSVDEELSSKQMTVFSVGAEEGSTKEDVDSGKEPPGLAESSDDDDSWDGPPPLIDPVASEGPPELVPCGDSEDGLSEEGERWEPKSSFKQWEALNWDDDSEDGSEEERWHRAVEEEDSDDSDMPSLVRSAGSEDDDGVPGALRLYGGLEAVQCVNTVSAEERPVGTVVGEDAVGNPEAKATEYVVADDVPAEVLPRIEAVVKEWHQMGEEMARGERTTDRGPFNFTLDTGGRTFVDRRRPLNPRRKALFQEWLNEMIATDRVFRVDDPTKVINVSNVTFPKKANGKERPCQDGRGVNYITEADKSHISAVREVIDAADPTCSVFAMLDLFWGFWQVGVAKADRLKTCFYGPDAHIYAWKVMAFGWKNATATFQRWVAFVVEGLPWVLVYVDDVCVEAHSYAELAERLEELTKRFKEHGVAVNVRKVQIGPEVKMLGWLRTPEGFLPHPDKVKVLREIGSPTNKRELRRVLGMLRYLAPCVPNLSRTVSRLNRLTGNVLWKWTDKDEEALRKGIELLADAVAQTAPDWDRTFHITTDASEDGIGGYLYQLNDDGEKMVIMCFGKALGSGPMSRWATIDKEAYAIVYAVDSCAQYVSGTRFVIHTDHRPLIYVRQMVAKQTAGGRLYRWFLLLSQFDFVLEYLPGTQNVVADALSRAPVIKPEPKLVSWVGGADAQLEEVDGIARDKERPVEKLKVAQLREALKEMKLPTDGARPLLEKRLRAGRLVRDQQAMARRKTASTLEEEKLEEMPSRKDAFGPDSSFRVDVVEAVARSILAGHGVPEAFKGEEFAAAVASATQAADELEIRNGRLMHKESGGFYIPVLEREDVLVAAHGAPAGGHFSARATLRKLDGRAWWPGMAGDVERLTVTCGSCQRNKFRKPIEADVQPLEMTSVGTEWHIDMVGPLTTTERGMRYILSAKDPASKYVVLVALRDKTARSVAGALVARVYLRLGWPERLVSDNGGEFVNQLNAELSLTLGIVHRTTAPYHPAGNGAVERFHRDLMATLRCITDPDQSRWDLDLGYAEWVHNTTWTRTTDYTPFFLMYGRSARSLVEAKLGTPLESTTENEWVTRLVRARRVAAARSGLARGLTPPETRVDAEEEREPAIKVDDLVLVTFTGVAPGKSRKLQPRQQGPYRVVGVRDGVTAQLVREDDPSERMVRHVSSLVAYKEPAFGDVGDYGYEVEEIRNEKVLDDETHYLVHWRGYGDEHDSWVRDIDLSAPAKLATWRERQQMLASEKHLVFGVFQRDGERYLCALVEDAGPSDREWIARDRVSNVDALDRFDARVGSSEEKTVRFDLPKESGKKKGGRGRKAKSKPPAPKEIQAPVDAQAPVESGGGVGKAVVKGILRTGARTPTVGEGAMTRGKAAASGVAVPSLSARF